MPRIFYMWRWCICFLLTIPFILLPIVWYTFPTSCQDGHIHYAEGHEHDSEVDEPWHCHVPRYTGCACTPGYDCLSGGLYGPTNNGALLIFLIVVGLFSLLFCTYEHGDTVDYEDGRRYSSARRPIRIQKNTRGLNGYPVR